MNDSEHKFDADRLFALKNDFCGYRFCPRCGSRMETRERDGLPRRVCEADGCGFVYYQNPIPAAGAIVVQNDQILLVKRAHPPRIGWWCIPAGFMEWNEHPEQTAKRELKEETGFEVELTSFFEVYSGNDDPRSNAVLMLYLARIVGGEMCASDDAEEVRFFPFDELPDSLAFEAHNQALADYRERVRDET